MLLLLLLLSCCRTVNHHRCIHTHTHTRVHTKADSHVLLEREKSKVFLCLAPIWQAKRQRCPGTCFECEQQHSHTHTQCIRVRVCVCIYWLAAHHNKSVLSEIHCRLNVNRKILFSMFFQLLFLYSVWRTQAYPVKFEVCRQWSEGYAGEEGKFIRYLRSKLKR